MSWATSRTASEPLLVGLDVGTTGCKCLVFTKDGRVVSSAYAEYRLYHRRPSWSELDPNEVWQAILRVLRGAVGSLGENARAIQAVSTSVLGEAFFLVDEEAQPLCWSMTTFDARAAAQVRWWEENLGSREMYSRTGQPLSGDMPIYTLQKAQWLRENELSTWAKAKRLVCWQDYVNLKLCGVPVMDYSLASRTMMFNIRRRKWDAEILRMAGLDECLLSDVAPSGTIVGEVSSSGASETGLPRGSLVVAGGHDQPCGALGVGLLQPGPVMDATGTVECVAAVQEELKLTEEMRLQSFSVQCYVEGDRYLVFGFNPSAGVILRWFRDNFGQLEKTEAEMKKVDAYDLLIQQAERAPPGSLGLMMFPFFEGSGSPRFRRDVSGVLVGLTLAQGRGEVIRSILEGVTLELRNIVEALEAHVAEARELRAIGGAAKSRFWLQLKADVTGRPIVLPEVQEAAALGAAMLAGVGAGVYKSFEDAAEHVYAVKEAFSPRQESVRFYEQLYARYKKLHEKMHSLML
ncbi:MAG: FGGY family carbohydrate kinase [Candidatus Bathyarchaeia archaeon]